MTAESGLWLAIKRHKRAVRLGAHPKLVEKLEHGVRGEALKVAQILNVDKMSQVAQRLVRALQSKDDK